MNNEYDVAVIGAGVIGASCAFHLSDRGLRVILLEERGSYAEGSTGRSYASVRSQWGDPLNIQLSLTSIKAYQNFASEHGVDVGYRPTGYLLLVPEARWDAHLGAVELQRSFGVDVEVLDVDAAQELTEFDPAGIAGAAWGPQDGQVDPHIVTAAYLDLARSRGTQVRFKASLRRAERLQGGWLLETEGTSVQVRHVVNAAGGWSADVARLAGLDVPVVHSRRNVFATGTGVLGGRSQPMAIDMGTGFFLRGEGDRILFGVANPEESAGYNTDLDWAWVECTLQIAVDRFPWFANLPLDEGASWAGTYEMTPDHLGIVGTHPQEPSWVNACGFSGHGIMQAPAIGALVAEEIVDGQIHSVDATALRISRFSNPAGSQPSSSWVV